MSDLEVRGFIYGAVGQKAVISPCPGLKLPFAFIGDPPEEFSRLKNSAEQRELVVGFTAIGNGYVVWDRPSDPMILFSWLDNVKEDPAVAAEYLRDGAKPSRK